MIEERVGFMVQGKVQGVGFRMWVKRAGLELRLRGSVRNRRDGSVELHVAGPSDAVATLERRLSQGPPGARVTGVVRTPSRMPIPNDGFQIEHDFIPTATKIALINGLIDRLKRANAEFGITMLIIEHNMRVIMNMASKIYCLAHGEMLAAGSPEEIQGNQNVVDAYLGAH